MVTNTDGSQKPCVFPFLVTGRTESGVNVTYDTCTNILDPDDRFWCSTKVRKYKNIELYLISLKYSTKKITVDFA